MDESSSFNHTDEDSTKKLMEEEIDKISGLSDPVLHHILSFLPTKYSVRTSILSSRWRHLWASVPTLRFDQKDFIVKPHFMDFVEGVLFLRDWSLPVRKVRLRCYDGAEFFRTTTWIRVLSRRSGLQELDLGAHPSPLDLHALPAELFWLNSLVKLKLNLHCHCSLVVPSVIHLNNLKSLHLKWVQFDDDQSVARLLSGCPQLEELIIEECNRVPLHNIVISGRFLKKFTMIETTNDEDDYDYYEDEVHGCMLTIDAPNLVVLNCCIEMPPAVIVGRLPCMEAADINLKSHNRDDNYCHMICELLKGVCETKVLRLSNSSMEEFEYHSKGYTKGYTGADEDKR
ncbi:F-box/LRR-repeat protein [Acorus gramineus]|uniref:F-box/LRR-repeat protein n=1 Tax=Acorus gramineus TaxID=55184 RepID=A0AAV9A9R6_ACOGR|nr:F-box/LRR-repeat protein [Acorus gramineus]